MSPPSSIRVFPAFSETAFFSGEELTCTLTFTNVAEVPSSPVLSDTGGRRRNGSVTPVLGSLARVGEWMSERGGSTSEAGVLPKASASVLPVGGRVKRLLHRRSRSTLGNKEENGKSGRTHSRTQSLAVSSTSETNPPRVQTMKRILPES
jgi:hypothetical protein